MSIEKLAKLRDVLESLQTLVDEADGTPVGQLNKLLDRMADDVIKARVLVEQIARNGGN